MTIQDVLSAGFTLYMGPCTDRMPLEEAHKNGKLLFSVNRPSYSTPIGNDNVLGWFENLQDALKALSENKEFTRISAHHQGWGFTEECVIYPSYRFPA